MISQPTAGPSSSADHVRFVIGLVTVLCCILAVMAAREKLLGDPDIWWHIKTGAWIWQHGAFPTVDPFSFSFAGHPWIAKEWLSQIVYFAAFALGGWNAVAFTGLAVIGASVAVLYWSVSGWLRPSLAAAVVLVCILLASTSITVRPHLLSLPLLVIWTDQLFKASQEGRSPNFLLLLVLVVWANLHAAFTMGFVIAFFAFLDVLEAGGLAKRGVILRWLAFLALCPVVSLIHPYTYQPMMATWLFIKPHDWVAPIVEWQPFNAQIHKLHAVALIGLAFAALVSGFRLGIARALLLALLVYLFMTHVRYAFFLFPVLTLVVAPGVAQQFSRLSFEQWRRQPLQPLEQRIGTAFTPIASVLTGMLVLVLGLQLLALPTSPPESVAVTDALSFVRSHGVTGNVMNHYGFGGPLIFNDIPTFIDGRTEQLFLGDFMTEFATGPGDEAGLSKAIDQYDVRWTIMPPGDARVLLLDKMPNWHRVYADKFAVIHQQLSEP